MFESLLPTVLDCGISIFDFWDMTYEEMRLVIDSFNRREKARVQEMASMNYQLGNLVGMSVARLFDEKAKYPTLFEAFPTLFDDLEIDTTPRQQDWRIMKDRLQQYATAHNTKIGGKK